MYQKITDENPYKTPMRIYPAVHYTMGGLWVDYNLMSTISGLHVIGEANFSDHGANRLGASALMQGLADGYFVLPYTIGNYFASEKPEKVTIDDPEFLAAEKDVKDRIAKFMSINGSKTPAEFHKELGHIMWDKCGMARSREGLTEAIQQIKNLKEQFWKNLKVTGTAEGLNQTLERAGRVADFLEFGELMCRDALIREESCGGHFRVEYQDEGEAKRDDEKFCHAAVWEYAGEGKEPIRHKEELVFESIQLATRSYK
jgi:succinate dehydrogenase / fumarate reductase flavoprotein subunit